MESNVFSRNMHKTQPICNVLSLGWTIAEFKLLWENWFDLSSRPFELLGSCCTVNYALTRTMKRAPTEDASAVWEITIGICLDQITSVNYNDMLSVHIQYDHEISHHSWSYYILGRDGARKHSMDFDSRDRAGLTFELSEDDLTSEDSNLLNDGCLEFRAELILFTVAERHYLKPEPVELAQHFDFNHLLETGDLSDFTIETNNESLKVHKAILAGRSPVLKAMFEADMKESIENCTRWDFADTWIIKKFLKFIYTDELEFDAPEESPKEEANLNLQLALILIQLADQYQLPKLKLLCELEMIGLISAESIVEVLRTADTFNSERLLDEGLKFVTINKRKLAAQEDLVALVAHSAGLGAGILKALTRDWAYDVDEEEEE